MEAEARNGRAARPGQHGGIRQFLKAADFRDALAGILTHGDAPGDRSAVKLGKQRLLLPESVRPRFDLLGTPKEEKALKLYETDHFVPRNELIKDTLAWLDRFLGPVKKIVRYNPAREVMVSRIRFQRQVRKR